MRPNRLILALAIWSVFGLVCLISERAHGSDQNHIPDAGKMVVPPGLQRIMSEGAGMVVNPTCDDVRAVVAWIGEARAESSARSAGATEAQIDWAKRCLKSSSR